MHYYQFNIGDYASHTRYLTPMQDLAYRRLIDLYYLQEKPIPKENTAALIGLNECRTDVEHVLNTYFILSEHGWINKRVEQEIQAYKGKSKVRSNAGKISGEVRRANKTKADKQTLNICTTDVDLTINQELLTNNHKPIKRIKEIAPPDGVLESVWQDFVSQRKAKKSAITQTALKGIEREANKANISLNDALQEICARGWTGFKAEWYLNSKSENKTSEPAWLKAKREWYEEAAGKTVTDNTDIFEMDTIQRIRIEK